MNPATMFFVTFRIGNRVLSFAENGLSLVGYAYTSLLANQPTPARSHWPRKQRTRMVFSKAHDAMIPVPRLFKGHRP